MNGLITLFLEARLWQLLAITAITLGFIYIIRNRYLKHDINLPYQLRSISAEPCPDIPANLLPFEIPALIQQKYHYCITIVILQLAMKGHLHFLRNRSLYMLTGSESRYLEKLDRVSQYVMEKLIERSWDQIDSIPFQKMVRANLMEKGYLAKTPPSQTLSLWISVSVVLCISILLLLSFIISITEPVPFLLTQKHWITLFFLFIALGVGIYCIIRFNRSHVTEQGNDIIKNILDFRIALILPKDDPRSVFSKHRKDDAKKVFELYLPYAYALGVAKQWGRQFEGVIHEPPEWFEMSGQFSMERLTHELHKHLIRIMDFLSVVYA